MHSIKVFKLNSVRKCMGFNYPNFNYVNTPRGNKFELSESPLYYNTSKPQYIMITGESNSWYWSLIGDLRYMDNYTYFSIVYH